MDEAELNSNKKDVLISYGEDIGKVAQAGKEKKRADKSYIYSTKPKKKS